jgi:hypothetical protein
MAMVVLYGRLCMEIKVGEYYKWGSHTIVLVQDVSNNIVSYSYPECSSIGICRLHYDIFMSYLSHCPGYNTPLYKVLNL